MPEHLHTLRVYPSNPTVEPAQPVGGEVQGTVLIEPFDLFADGERLRAGG